MIGLVDDQKLLRAIAAVPSVRSYPYQIIFKLIGGSLSSAHRKNNMANIIKILFGGGPPQTGLSAQQNSDTVGTKDLPPDTRCVVKSQSSCDVHTFLSGLRGAAITAGMKRYPSYSRLL